MLGLFFALSFFVFYYGLDKPLFNFMMEKYFDNNYSLFTRNRLPEAYFRELMRVLSRDLGWWILAHAGLTAYAAVRLSKWWWFAVRVPGFYAVLILAMIFEQRVVM